MKRDSRAASHRRPAIIYLLALTPVSLPLLGGPLRVGNILVTNRDVLEEHTPDGDLVQSFQIPFPPFSPRPANETVQDMVLTADCRVAMFNGAFVPRLSILDPVEGTWKHLRCQGW